MMGVSLTVVSHAWQSIQKRDKEEELLFIGDQMRRALALYAANATGPQRYPQSLQDLLKDTRYPVPRRYLRKIYADPFNGREEWGLVKGPGDVIMGIHSLSEGVPLKKSRFKRGDQTFEGKSKYSEWIFMPGSSVAQAGGAAASNAPAQAGTAQPRLGFAAPR